MKLLHAPVLVLALLLSPLGSGTLHAAPDIGQKAYDKALALLNDDKPEQAEKAARALVAARTKALGPDDRETLQATLLLARTLGGQHLGEKSAALLHDLLPRLTQVFGTGHREPLICQAELAAALGYQRQYAEAAEKLRSLIPEMSRTLGPYDAETLRNRERVASLMVARWTSCLRRKKNTVRCWTPAPARSALRMSRPSAHARIWPASSPFSTNTPMQRRSSGPWCSPMSRRWAPGSPAR